MKLYFDTNIYRFITERDEAIQVAALLEKFACRLTVSAGNLFETWAMDPALDPAREIATITKLGNSYLSPPESYLHALEVRFEVKRIRRPWINPFPLKREIRKIGVLLDGHKEHWTRALTGDLPPATAFNLYKISAEQGIDGASRFQKDVRADFLDPSRTFELQTPGGATISINLHDPDVFWRFQGLSVWYEALEKNNPASRDYADWLKPHLRPHTFADPSYTSFWLKEMMAEAVPLNRLTGLISYYQLKQKISHGNSADQIHASCWLFNDLFLTADRGLFKALSLAAQHFPNRSAPVLVDRAGSSFASQLDEILKAKATEVKNGRS